MAKKKTINLDEGNANFINEHFCPPVFAPVDVREPGKPNKETDIYALLIQPKDGRRTVIAFSFKMASQLILDMMDVLNIKEVVLEEDGEKGADEL